MIKKMLIGASAFALATGIAHAAPNDFTLWQVGNQNNANGNQVGGTSETAYIEQVGNKNSATTNQQNPGNTNFGWVAQRGDTNTSMITQNGTNNEADVFQGCGYRRGVVANGSRCSGGGEIIVTGTNSSVTMNGGNGFTVIDQLASGNSATVTQTGTNMGRAGSSPGTGGALGNVSANADIEQYSQSNIATVQQSNSSTLNASTNSHNVGNEGNVTIFQGVRYPTAAGSFITPADAAAATYASPTDAGSNQATVNQNAGATNSHVYIAQYLSSNLALVTQNGSDEYAEIRQDNTTGGAVIGNNNADVTQSGAGATALVYQNGISNSATLNQSSAGATANINQIGNQNVTHINQ
jgi:hypothetical protein